LIYRGDFLRADRDGMRGLFVRRPRFEVNVSLNATVPVSSAHSITRSGMPDLRSTVEIGPALEWHLWRSADGGTRLDLRAPLRTAITVQAPPHDIGWVAAPAANIDILDAFGHDGWNLGLLSGPLFANRRYHEYFYGVPGAYATLQRPAYSAPGGYSGTEALVALSKRYRNFWVGAFLRHDWLSGAAFIASPLLQQRSYWAGGAGIAWMIGQSSQQVNVDD
ncbi:MAG: MipA/OmpV family protein, partial [Steroidobacterales bacterium]